MSNRGKEIHIIVIRYNIGYCRCTLLPEDGVQKVRICVDESRVNSALSFFFLLSVVYTLTKLLPGFEAGGPNTPSNIEYLFSQPQL